MKKVNQFHQRGSLIILGLIIIFAMSAIGLSLAQTVLTQYGTNKRQLYVENAVSAAEAGVSATLQQLNINGNFSGYADTSRQVLYPDDPVRGKADYSTTVTNNADGTKTITANGYTYKPGSATAYNTKTIKVVVQGTGTSVAAGVVAGPGGLVLTYGSIMTKNVYVNGQVNVGSSTNIGCGGLLCFFNPTDVNVNVANMGCGSGASYPQACSGQAMTVGWNGGVYGTVCATGQTDATNIYTGTSGLGLKPSCTAQAVTMPVYDRSGMYNAMLAANGTKTVSSGIGSCGPFGGNLTIAKDQIYTGTLSTSGNSCTATIKGNFYLTGDLNVTFFSNLKVDNALTSPPIILVDGNVNFNTGGLIKNSSGIGAIVISFKSADASCDHTCNSISATNLYNTVNTITASCSDQFCDMRSSVIYSYFGTAKVTNAGTVSGIGGQRVWIDALSTFQSDAVNKTGLQNDDAFNGGAKLTKWKAVDYKQVYP